MPLSWSRAVQRYDENGHKIDFDHSEVEKATSSDLNDIKTLSYPSHGEFNFQRTEYETHGNHPNNGAIRIFLKTAKIDFDHSEVDKATSSDLNDIKI